MLKEAGVEIVYKHISKKKKRSTFYKVLRKLRLYKNKSNNEFSSLQQPFQYNLAILSVGNSLDSKIISYTDFFKFHDIPYVLVIQLATDLRNAHDNLLSKLSVAYTEAKAVCFLSKDNLVKTEMNLGCKLDNITYINNPFNYEQKYVTPSLNSYHTIACVGAFTSFHKGQDLLISVLGQEKWKNRKIVLNLYGDGINKKQIERLINRYDLHDKVKIIGYETDKEKIWSNNLACIMPSRMEGQSLAMLEAMSFGRMIISTRVGDAERLIEEGTTGFLIDCASLEAIDGCLEKAWEHKDFWIEMGKKMRKNLYSTITVDPVEAFLKKTTNWIKHFS